MKNNLNDVLSVAIENTSVEEVKLLAGQTLNLHCDFVISISHDCVIDYESLAKSKHAFIKTLKRCLAKQGIRSWKR